MPAITWDITVEQGSWEPSYIALTDPTTGAPLDLTAPGYSVRGVVATRRDGLGTLLATFPDGEVLRRTATGRLYFEPPTALTAGWSWRRGYHQVELTHPTGQTVRVAQGQILVNPELVV